MRFLLATYSAAGHNSYGIVTRNLWRRLQAFNPRWEIYQQGWFHRGGVEKVGWGIEPTRASVNPATGRMALDQEDMHGQKSFEDVVKRMRPDVVWSLGDPYMMHHMGQYRPRYGFRLVKHCPADGAPQPQSWRDVVRDCDLLSPITKFAARLFHSYMPETDLQDLYARTIYHGVDRTLFRPAPQGERPRPEAAAVTDDTFLMGFNGFMQGRKNPWILMLVLRHLLEGAYWIKRNDNGDVVQAWPDQYDDISRSFVPQPEAQRVVNAERGVPQKVALWCHTPKRPNAVNNHDLNSLIDLYGVQDKVIISKGLTNVSGIPDAEMPAFYQALDCYLALSGGEGFCLPIVEAYASGVPVIYTDYSGQAEVGAYAGLPVRPSVVAREVGANIGRAVADVGMAIVHVLNLIEHKELREEVSLRGLRAAQEVFDWDIIAGQWNQLLTERVQPRRVVTTGISV